MRNVTTDDLKDRLAWSEAQRLARLAQLGSELSIAKMDESNAKKRRIQAEEEIANLVETPANGSKTVDAGNGIKLTVKRGLSYKAVKLAEFVTVTPKKVSVSIKM